MTNAARVRRPGPAFRVFLAGVIQGNRRRGIRAQDWRRRLARIIRARAPRARLYDPFARHPRSLAYPDDLARRVFLRHVRRAAASDLVVVFLPEASMGSAVEMWAARAAGVPVAAVSPLAENWTVKFLADALLPDLAAFDRFAAAGGLERLAAAGRRRRGARTRR